jgi:hypothetical protein
MLHDLEEVRKEGDVKNNVIIEEVRKEGDVKNSVIIIVI